MNHAPYRFDKKVNQDSLIYDEQFLNHLFHTEGLLFFEYYIY